VKIENLIKGKGEQISGVGPGLYCGFFEMPLQAH